MTTETAATATDAAPTVSAWRADTTRWMRMLFFEARQELDAASTRFPDDPAQFLADLPHVLALFGVHNISNPQQALESAANTSNFSAIASTARNFGWQLERHLIRLLDDGHNDAADPICYLGRPELQREMATVNGSAALPWHMLPEPFAKIFPYGSGALSLILVGPAGAVFSRYSDARQRTNATTDRLAIDAAAKQRAVDEAALAEKRRWEESDSGKLAQLQQQIDELKTQLANTNK